MKAVQVVTDGNRRKGGMNDHEQKQCVHDIVNWFARNANLEIGGDNADELKSLEDDLELQLPAGLSTLLETQSGGIWFEESKLLTVKGIRDTTSTSSAHSNWNAAYIPFASDTDGSLLIVDTKKGDAVSFFHEDGKGKKVSASFSQFLEDFCNQLLSNRFSFVQGVGLVERSCTLKKK
uniref:Uncharacterized protein AlNc14C128G6875 n=1 Tax=Albugo laibachii Nc14 TaxID=890382 RepID=F0WK21_9STRA|nr:hypothetical protein PITG_12238 [Albugo laibachii Nc14]|eukprot:CCA21623.1 hypothetical protein PITG_12238 [Albugo laibachii Nc14]